MLRFGSVLTILLLTVVSCGTDEDAVNSGSDKGDGSVAGTAQNRTPVPQGTGVRGRVTNTSDAPVELAAITVTGGASGPVTQEANVTDADGRYFFPLPPGRWEIEVTAHRYQPDTSSIVVAAGKPTVHDLVLERADR